MLDQSELEEFKTEALELLDTAEKSILAIDAGGDFKSAYDAAFRSFHNLKGAAGMMELTKLQSHTHEIESTLMSFKEKKNIPKNYLSFFLDGIDAARSILQGEEISFCYEVSGESKNELKENSVETTIDLAVSELAPGLEEYLAECDEILDRVSKYLVKMESEKISIEEIHALYRDVHTLKGTSFLFNFQLIGDIAHAVESSLDELREDKGQATAELINILFKLIKNIEQAVQCIKENKSQDKLKESSYQLIKELESIDWIKKNPVVETVLDIEQESAPSEDQVVKSDLVEKKNKEIDIDSNSTIRVSVSLLDKLMNLMGEMVLVRNQVLQYSNESEDLDFLNLSQRLNVVTSEIQEEMMKTRMQPIGNVLSKFNRVVRDLSKDLKKAIHFEVEGAETELDKSLLEAIKDPLTHIIRNSCDHGIEDPSDRKKRGKEECGNLKVRAFHESGQVVIEIIDDGKGLDKKVLLKKAIEKEIIRENQTASLSEKEIFNLIFSPGFSTAAKVTNVSGRGVGMDVVKTNIEKIGGTVELTSNLGKGTMIRLKIPLTLAIIPALIVRSGTSTFAIPQLKLVELVRVEEGSKDKIESLHGKPVYRLRGSILPLVDLNKVLNLHKNKEVHENINIAVLNVENHTFGLIVDKIEDTADIVVKPLPRLLKSLQVYSGATILGDGSVSLILDVQGLARVANLNNVKEMDPSDKERSARELSQITMDYQDYLLFGVNSKAKYSIVLNYVHRLEEFNQFDIEWSGKQRIIRYRNSSLPLIDINNILGFDSCSEKKDKINVVVVERGGRFFGLEVDSILDTLSSNEVLEPLISAQKGILGNLNLKDQLIVVLDPFELISLAFPDYNQELCLDAENKSTSNQNKGAILVVEDTVFFRNMLKHILAKKGHSVTAVNDGEEALHLLRGRDQPFDLILSDIEMPKVDGFKLAQEIRKHEIHQKTPLLALSSRFDPKYVKKGRDSGFDSYLEKLKPDLLVQEINKLITKNRNVA